jgi:opacity protein-like surface antigen
MKTATLLALATGALVVASPLAAQAPMQASSTKGFIAGIHVTGTGLTIDEFDETTNGGGAGVVLGYGFTRRLALVADFTAGALEDNVGFGNFDLGLRYAWTGAARRWVPSLELGVAGRAIGQSDVLLDDGATHDVTFSGAGITLGAGIQYYTTPKWAVGAALKWTGGQFDKVQVDDVSVEDLNIDATSTRFNIGVTWYPGGGR